MPAFRRQSGSLSNALLTRIDFDYTTFNNGNGFQMFPDGGLENETDADGGTNIQNLAFPTKANNSVNQTISQKIKWRQRYNYRIGVAQVYTISNIKLYRNGILSETQSGTAMDISIASCPVGGVNLDPNNRNVTYSPTYNTPYPKSTG